MDKSHSATIYFENFPLFCACESKKTLFFFTVICFSQMILRGFETCRRFGWRLLTLDDFF